MGAPEGNARGAARDAGRGARHADALRRSPTLRDQAILEDAVLATQGKVAGVDWAFGVDEARELAAKTAPATPTPPAVPRQTRTDWKAAINPQPDAQPVSTAFGWNADAEMDMLGTAVTTPPAEKFPYDHTRYQLNDGTKQSMYWRTEPSGPGVAPQPRSWTGRPPTR